MLDPLAMEAEASRRLYYERRGRHRSSRRQLSHPPPAVHETTQHGMMIDAYVALFLARLYFGMYYVFLTASRLCSIFIIGCVCYN